MKPNIILILTDHFRKDFVNQKLTPNLMAIAGRGLRFSNCYCAAPLCQPSRNCIISGAFPSQHGVSGNQSPAISDVFRADTLMQRLRAAGYHTNLIGKHHYIDRYGIGMDVRHDDATIRAYGFDQVTQVVDDGENEHNDDEYTAYLEAKGLLAQFRSDFQANTAAYRHPFAADDSADGFIGGKAVEFVRGYTGTSPFYLNVGFVGPHPPYWHPGDLTVDPEQMDAPLGVADSVHVRTRRAHYAEKCRLIDAYLGKLIDALRETGRLADTVFVFTSDHGDCLGDFGIWDKRYFYEQSVGVPLIIAGPGVPAGERMNGPRVCRNLVSHVDLYPTILNLAGSDVAQQPTVHAEDPRLDSRTGGNARSGEDIVAAVSGGRMRSAVFAELATATMVRTANWKLVFDAEQGGVTDLYNLRVDPNELQNLAGVAGYEQQSATLVATLLAHRIRLTQFTHAKEEQRLQRVRTH